VSPASATLIASIGVPAHRSAQGGGLVPVPARTEGERPFDRLILHGGIVIDGTVYDAKQLRADIRKMVGDAKSKEKFEFAQPGLKKGDLR
jgi:hypothetical protein